MGEPMGTFALVFGEHVANVYLNVDDPDVSHPAISSRMVACGADVQPGWLYRDGLFIDPATLVPEPTVRQKRRAAYFEAFRTEDRDDHLVVLGDCVDKLIAQIAAVVPAGQRTPEFAELLTKVLQIKAQFPKPGGG